MSAEGITVFVTTHYLDEAEHCHRLALIHAGKLVALGTVPELKHVFAGRAVLEVIAPRVGEALEAIGSEPWALETSVFGTRIHVVVADEADGRRRVQSLLEARGNPAEAVERILPSLEDVFIHHVEKAEEERREARA
jgi:ABC-2 type transport system ATP-binding protein